MSDSNSMYGGTYERDHIRRLYEIASLSTVGAAATDTKLNVSGLMDAQCSMFEVIHRLACEAIDIAETGKP
ncbi:MAG: hypothetical protein OIF40_10265 [Mangrovicoccus sp.]|nr:hypothetical protein [Mangrovicoccus sp.]